MSETRYVRTIIIVTKKSTNINRLLNSAHRRLFKKGIAKMKRIITTLVCFILLLNIFGISALAEDKPGTSEDNPDVLIEQTGKGDYRPTSDWDITVHTYYGSASFSNYVYSNYNYYGSSTINLYFSADCSKPKNLYIYLYEKSTNTLVQVNYYYNVTDLSTTITYTNLNSSTNTIFCLIRRISQPWI